MAYPPEWETIVTAKNGQNIRFRPEKSSDTEMLWAMFSTLSETTTSNLIPPFTRERIERWTSNIDYKETLAIVAIPEDTPRIIGTTSLNFNVQEVFRHKAELGLTIHDDYQNLGIGTALLNHILAIAKKQRLRKIQLLVNVENARAIHIY
jgi:putative acetyltransferase